MLSFKEKIRLTLKRIKGRNETIRNAQRKMFIGFFTSIAIALFVGAGLSIVRDDGVSNVEAILLFVSSVILLITNLVILTTLEVED